LNSVRKLYPSIALAVPLFCDAVRAQRLSPDLHGRLLGRFASNTIDTNKYQPDAPFFEGVWATFTPWRKCRHAIRRDDDPTMVVWRHAARRAHLSASEGANVAVSIDRVAEAGLGSASRSALWILDETRTKYVLFADVRGEGNWHYNRKIGEAGDSPRRRRRTSPLRRRDL